MSESFWTRAAEDPDHVAVIDHDGRRITAGALLGRVNRLSAAMSAEGVQVGDGVACVLGNTIDFVALYMAVMQSGLYLTPINWHLTAEETSYVLADSSARLLVTEPRHAEVARDAAHGAGLDPAACLVAGEARGHRSLAEFEDGHPEGPPRQRCAGRLMLYSSGTTGRPKGIRKPLSDADVDVEAGAWAGFGALFDIVGPGVHLVTAPMYHAANVGFGMGAMHIGRTLVLMDGWSAEGMLTRIAQHQVTSTHVVPTMFHRLLALPQDVRDAADVTSLTSVVHAAAPCPIGVKRAMLDWWGPVIHEYYAATEGGGTHVGPVEWLEHPGTVGRAWPGADIRVLDDEGNECAPGQAGLVYMKLRDGGMEYWRDAEKTRGRIRDGYITAGDIGEMDAEGWLYLRDRRADTIVSGGVNIYPAEIEAVLSDHPAVEDCAVIGIPDEEWGESVRAHVVLRHDLPDVERALDAHCRAALASFKVPRSWVVTTSLPRDPSGKLLRRRLREAAWAARERHI